jgi:hypothetical protein
VAGCGASQVVPLNAAIPITHLPAVPLEITTRSTAIRDPLPLGVSGVRFAGLEEPLGHAVATATVQWAEAHADERPGGWQLLVELVQADVERPDERVIVTLGVRATLRRRQGNVYIAQTQAHCREAAHVAPAAAAPLFYGCMMDVGRNLAGWLGGLQP